MSNWISWARDKIGMSDGTSDEYYYRGNEDDDAYDMRRLEADRSALLRTQRLQLAQLQDELEEVQELVTVAVKKKDQNAAYKHLERKSILEEEIETLEGKIQNQEYLQKQVNDAHQNRDQARIMEAGSKQMETIVKQTEQIDLDSTLDRYEDMSRTTSDMNKRLAKPMRRGGTNQTRRKEAIDNELERLMQEQEDKTMAELDSDSHGVGANPQTQSQSLPSPREEDTSFYAKLNKNKPVLQEEK